jgi:hypothetical protein
MANNSEEGQGSKSAVVPVMIMMMMMMMGTSVVLWSEEHTGNVNGPGAINGNARFNSVSFPSLYLKMNHLYVVHALTSSYVIEFSYNPSPPTFPNCSRFSRLQL